ncbi:tRNA (adenosine(37)-N6)-threonylcarbamoyltransferase complex ATPase subunit type 1 TsaE [Phormidium sp. CLA17]|uniref:tRNA (adenosine(37)-N6)-threonylcarbamoyltransferase complex ATPase subunit type 1 TsaE n=1 Tax=Leptolyngbya sp. Cla-17 TaxID=2803751 RepID=UPI0014920709|nr:tRNA (adenosine(37)-N6)-threonylcarbamoyltransferase complex ATPase subunit type 1 TsaE [Leptolyngbya sp. Cla-17]MBM0743014.1 tRNA (adenosine(37)-N6)-threonylcarbamoyltransferase complex ATPase subunit type 1 TsaE [Leptolyngbya sp. Cla-17]
MASLIDPVDPSSVTLSNLDIHATRQIGRQLGQTLAAGSVLLLEGELGSGKTTLVQAIGEGLKILETIDSPTFTLINEYMGGRLPLYHMDLYRLQSDGVAQLYPDMYWEGLEVEPGIVAIEWAERLPYRPAKYLLIRLCGDDNQRQISLMPVGNFKLPMIE